MIQKAKNVFALLIVLTVCGYAMWKEMQFVAVVALIAAVSIIYRTRATRLADVVADLVRNTRQAKYGDFELHVDKKLQDWSPFIAQTPPWVQILASRLSGDEIGSILTIYRSENHPIVDAQKNQFRILRKRGLIGHDGATMEKSSRVYLTALGNDFAEALLQVDLPLVESGSPTGAESRGDEGA